MLASEFPSAKDEHDYEMDDKTLLYVCKRCNHSVKKLGSGGVCIGIPIISSWEDVPEFLAAKTKLFKLGKKPHKDQLPAAAKKQYNRKGKFTGHYYPLYNIDEALPKQGATQAQLEALEKARYMGELLPVPCADCKGEIWGQYNVWKETRKELETNPEKYANALCDHCELMRQLKLDKQAAIEWSQDLLKRDDVVILDTETSDMRGEIIEIGILTMDGTVLLDQRIKPLGTIAEGAKAVHGISLEDLADCPTFPEVYQLIVDATKDKLVIIYNKAFDRPLLNYDCERHELDKIKFKSECAMEMYAQFCGEWSEYWGSYRWQKLNGTHGALGDCKATLAVLHEMAESKG